MVRKRRSCNLSDSVPVSFRVTRSVLHQLSVMASELDTSISHCVWLIVKNYFDVPEEV